MSVLTKFIRIISNYRAFSVIPLATLKLEKAPLKAFSERSNQIAELLKKSFWTQLYNFLNYVVISVLL